MADESEERGFVIRDRRISSESGEEAPAVGAPDGVEAEEAHGEPAPSVPPLREDETRTSDTPAPEPLPPSQGEPVPLTFGTFVLSLATQVMVSLGLIPNPLTNERELDFEAAEQTIDILGILHEKTKGNLTPDEEQLMTDILYDLRLRYVEVTKGQ